MRRVAHHDRERFIPGTQVKETVKSEGTADRTGARDSNRGFTSEVHELLQQLNRKQNKTRSKLITRFKSGQGA